jgi:hypothetical protein
MCATSHDIHSNALSNALSQSELICAKLPELLGKLSGVISGYERLS